MAGPERKRGLLTPATRIAGALIIVGLMAATLFAIYATDQPSFCGSCHEMKPFFAAWGAGKHREVMCVRCHVDPGLAATLAHKFVALREVYVHVLGTPRFPMAGVEVPDARCRLCHPKIVDRNRDRFSHGLHVGKIECFKCHTTAGHAVTDEVLAAAGVLAAPPPASAVSGTTTSGPAGHVPTACFPCHRSSTSCVVCHKATHDQRGPCERCHRPGTTWAFDHPPAGEHRYTDFPCAKCHPAGLTSVGCACHGPGGPPGE